ncbi:hypothetical protein [Halorubellus litoreus]|uniref:Uncharacterized protein n=1 Tax=Halorubellus litoreus TaxID=755308 RepID=A0ABD5VPZ7_9EURY
MRDSSRQILDEKVDEFIKTIDEGNLVKDEGTENILGLEGYHLLPGDLPLHEFYMDELHYFSKCLIDSALKTHTNAKTTDFSAYWGWTAALVSHTERNQDFERYQEILRDYYYLVHSALVSERHSRLVRENHDLHMTLSRLNPSLEEVTRGSGLPLAATFGFSVLEGLLKRRCSDLSPDTGINVWSGFEKLIDDSDVSPVVKEVLQTIDDLDRYDRQVLERKMSGVPDLSDKDSLLWLVKEQRNYNVHGEGSTQAIGSLVLTLCSLVLLDELATCNYQETRTEVLQDMQHSQSTPMIHSKSPRAFYPVEVL